MKNLRHSSLDSNIFNMYGKYQVGGTYSKKDINVQKIKVKLIFRYVILYLRDWIFNFHKLFSLWGSTVLPFFNFKHDIWEFNEGFRYEVHLGIQ